ncbi:hypothetical protein Ancab_036483 [Ancistrocladus abbreviatus]
MNMIFMDRNSSVMEFFPKGWLELAGMCQYCYRWLADQAGKKHPSAWRGKLDKKNAQIPKTISSAGTATNMAKWYHRYNSDPETLISKLRDSFTFLPLKDLRFAKTAMEGNTWFLSSLLNDTYEENEADYLHFPSQSSKGRFLCIRGSDMHDGAKNSHALAWPESLPEKAHLFKGLASVSNIYYVYENLWHGISAMAPFVDWSLKNGCLKLKPSRWLFFHQGELRTTTRSWLRHLMQANFGQVPLESFARYDVPYCFENAVVCDTIWVRWERRRNYRSSSS